MGLPTGIRMDDDGNVVFEGRSGQGLLFVLLTRAKFARPYEGNFLLNPWVAELMVALDARVRAGLPSQTSPPTPMFDYDPTSRVEIAEVIATGARHLGWWGWSREERARFVRDVICAPHFVSDEAIDDILVRVEDEVEAARSFVAAADAGAPP